jgi:hypothetical protein
MATCLDSAGVSTMTRCRAWDVGRLLASALMASACWSTNRPSAREFAAAGRQAPDAAVATAPPAFTPGHLVFDVHTKPSDTGQFAPKNALAIWIEAVDGTPVKVLGLWAGVQRPLLVHFSEAFPPKNLDDGYLVDAVAAASQLFHQPRKVRWDATDKDGATVPDGEYALMVELVDGNDGTVFSSLPFTKGAQPLAMQWPDSAEFGPMTLVYQPGDQLTP